MSEVLFEVINNYKYICTFRKMMESASICIQYLRANKKKCPFKNWYTEHFGMSLSNISSQLNRSK